MQTSADKFAGQLRQGLAPIYLIGGDEPLLVEEAIDALRAAAHAAGFGDREVYTVEAGFDWDAFYSTTQSMSLFSERRLIELRLPNAKPGEAGAKILTQIAAERPSDVVVAVTTGKLDKTTRAVKWVKAIEGAGTVVIAYPVDATRLTAWIRERLRARGVRAAAGVAELLAHHMEGNLLAAAQEIDKLALVAEGREVTPDDIEKNLSDNARFNVFGLVDTCLAGKPAAILRTLRSLRAEGVEPVLVTWALVREIRELSRMAALLASGTNEARVLQAAGVWAKRQPLVRQALHRLTAAQAYALLDQAARVDRIIKGRAAGDAWLALERLALRLGGLRLAGEQAV